MRQPQFTLGTHSAHTWDTHSSHPDTQFTLETHSLAPADTERNSRLQSSPWGPRALLRAQLTPETHSAHAQLLLHRPALRGTSGAALRSCRAGNAPAGGPGHDMRPVPLPPDSPPTGTRRPGRAGCPPGEAISPTSSATPDSCHLLPLPTPHGRGSCPGPWLGSMASGVSPSSRPAGVTCIPESTLPWSQSQRGPSAALRCPAQPRDPVHMWGMRPESVGGSGGSPFSAPQGQQRRTRPGRCRLQGGPALLGEGRRGTLVSATLGQSWG